jgi:hypothetical protein
MQSALSGATPKTPPFRTRYSKTSNKTKSSSAKSKIYEIQKRQKAS